MELVPTIIIAASACGRDPECMCDLCMEAEEDGGVTPVPWRRIAAMECATNPHCPCESCAYGEDDLYEGPIYFILDFRLNHELLANQQQVLTTNEVDSLPRNEGLDMRYLILEYWSGRTFCIIQQEPPIYDADGYFLGYTNEP